MTSLSFSDQCLGDSGLIELCTELSTRADVSELDLRGCHILGEGVPALAELLHKGAPMISSLSLEWNQLGTSDAGPRALAIARVDNASLTHLDLRNNRIGSSGVAALAEGLAKNHTLRSLDLRWNAAGTAGAHALEAALEENRCLVRLQLQGNRVPEDSLRRIAVLLGRAGAAAAAV